MVDNGHAVPEKLRPYIHHGVQIEPPKSGNEARGTCPFCDKEDHFYVNIHTGLWSCKRCGTGSGKAGGNVFTFLNELFTQSLTMTTATDWKELSADRNLPIPFLKRWDLAKHFINAKWIVAGRNAKGDLVNLYTREATGLFSTPTCSLTLIGLHKLTDKQKRVWINEGIWDAIAWDYALSSLGKKRGVDAPFAITNEAASLRVTNGVVAAPGCSNFKEEWGPMFSDREVGILFDNDHPKKHPKSGRVTQPGWDGVQRASQIVAPFADGTEVLKWGKPGYDKRLPDGFDIRDLVIRDKPAKAYQLVMSRLESVKATKVASTAESKPLEGLPRHSFQEVLADFEQVLHVTPTLRDCIAITFASVISTNLGGDQLWLRVIGPPGSGKTTLAEAISAAREFTMPRSLITGFHSGYIGEGRAASRKKDAALIPKMNGKTVIIKDADTIVSSGHRDRILSELRDIYDGVSRSEYRNRKSSIYENLRITFILCGTDRLRSLNRTFLGERFLDVEIIAGEDHKPFLQRSLSNAYKSIMDTMAKPPTEGDDDPEAPPEAMDLIKRGTIGFLTHKREALSDHQPPQLDPSEGDQIMALAQFLSYMRARLESNHEELGHRPRAELATRLVAQLTKMAIVLAIVLDRPVVDAEVMRLVRKVVLDTAVGFQLEINLLLIRQGPLSTQQMSVVLGITDTHIRTLVKQMQELGIVRRLNRPNNSGIRGRDTHVWQLTPLLEQLINDSGLIAAKPSTNGVASLTRNSGSKRAKKPTRTPVKH